MSKSRFPLLTAALLGMELVAGISTSSTSPAMGVADRVSTMVEDAMVYPQYMAGQQPEEGVVLVAFTVGSSGSAEDVKLVESSGHAKIDRAALAAIASLRHLPAEAAGRHSIAVLQYRDGRHGSDASAARTLRAAVTRLQENLPDVLVPTRYLR